RRNLGPVWTPHSGAGVPTCRCGEGTVVTLRDIVEVRLIRIQDRIDVAGRVTVRGVDSRDEASPERRHRTGSANHRVATVDPYVVARVLIGVAGHIRYAPLGELLGAARRQGRAESFLVRRQWKEGADTATGRATLRA